MTPEKDSARKVDWKTLMGEQEDLQRPLVQRVIGQILEAEMDEALGAGKSERTAGRLGHRSGYFGRTRVTRFGNLR